MPNEKLHINSTISDAHLGACYLGIDIPTYLSVPIYLITNTCKYTPPKYRNKYGTNTTSKNFLTILSTSNVGLPWVPDGQRTDAPVNEDQNKDQVSTYQ